MNKGNRIFSAVLVAASICFLFVLLMAGYQVSDRQLLELPSYYRPVQLTPVYIMCGCAAALGIFGCFFAWLRVKRDEEEGKHKEEMITQDVTAGMEQERSWNQDTAETITLSDEEETRLVSEDSDITEAVFQEPETEAVPKGREDKE